MQETLYETVDAGVSLSDSGCRRLSIRQRMQETLYQIFGSRDIFFRQQMQENLYQTADVEDSLSDSGCRRLSIRQQMQRLSIRQRMQEPLNQTADAGVYQTADA